MSLLHACVEDLRTNVALSELTSYRLGGCAKHLVSARDADHLRDAVDWAKQNELPVRILGGGANVLVADTGFEGLVIRLDHAEFRRVEYDGDRVIAGGGVDLMRLARDCTHRGLAGLECMAGIPGTVGGAVTMNAGGRFGQFGDVVESVRLLTADGSVDERGVDEMGFGYRSSMVGDAVVLGASLRLEKEGAQRVLSRFRDNWSYKKRTQPLAAHSAGCMFKNPPGQSAGQLIDAAGLKGARVGKASVSRRHANFVVAEKGATATEVLQLAERIRSRVLESSGTLLEYEIDVWR